MAKETKITYTDNDRAIVNALRDSEGLTLAQLCEVTGLKLVAGHIVSAMRKGLIEASGEVEVIKPTTRKVSTYNYVSSDVMNREDGKAWTYTDGEKAILNAASSIDSPFTLAQLATAMNVEKVFSGSINGLVKKGNITKGDQVEVPATAKSLVKVYRFVKDIPDAE